MYGYFKATNKFYTRRAHPKDLEFVAEKIGITDNISAELMRLFSGITSILLKNMRMLHQKRNEKFLSQELNKALLLLGNTLICRENLISQMKNWGKQCHFHFLKF